MWACSNRRRAPAAPSALLHANLLRYPIGDGLVADSDERDGDDVQAGPRREVPRRIDDLEVDEEGGN